VKGKISDNTALKQYNMNDLDHLDELSSSVDDVKTATTKLRIYIYENQNQTTST